MPMEGMTIFVCIAFVIGSTFGYYLNKILNEASTPPRR
jgi:hypothetical protein